MDELVKVRRRLPQQQLPRRTTSPATPLTRAMGKGEPLGAEVGAGAQVARSTKSTSPSNSPAGNQLGNGSIFDEVFSEEGGSPSRVRNLRGVSASPTQNAMARSPSPKKSSQKIRRRREPRGICVRVC